MPLPYIVAIIVTGLIAVAATIRFQPAVPAPRSSYIWLLGLLVVSSLLATRVSPASELSPGLGGLVIGAVLAATASFGGNRLTSLALALVGAASVHLAPSVAPAQLGLAIGAGLGAIALAGDSINRFALWCLLAISADRLGASNSDAPGFAYLGTLLTLVLIIGGVAGIPIPKKLEAALPFLAAIIIALGGVLLSKYVAEPALTVAIGLGALVGLVLRYLVEEGESSSLRVGIATILSIGLATVAFATFRGLGMSLSLLAAAGVLATSPNRRALLTLGPLVGLVLYRVLREEGTGASRALDIGQHYTLLALGLGAIVPLILVDWRGKSAGLSLWAILGISVPPIVITMFGVRGAVGFIVGLGFAATIDSLRKAESLTVYAAAAIMAPVTLITLHWAKDVDSLTRDEKVPLFIGIGTVILVLAGVLTILARGQQTEAKA